MSPHVRGALRGSRLKKLLRRALDETEFLSDHGLRSLSKAHAAEPFVLERDGTRHAVEYAPGESTSGLFGGNSNWRGPAWMPLNALVIDALRQFHSSYDPGFRVACPVGSGVLLDLGEVAEKLARRLGRLFPPGPGGGRSTPPRRGAAPSKATCRFASISTSTRAGDSAPRTRRTEPR